MAGALLRGTHVGRRFSVPRKREGSERRRVGGVTASETSCPGLARLGGQVMGTLEGQLRTSAAALPIEEV